jgi:membrane-bound lytic murein transglycosylase F
MNQFFELIMRSGKFDRIYTKYYGNVHDFDYVDLRTFHRRIDSRLSRYSPFIKEAAHRHGFDWRLIAAQMYQESHLYPWAQSSAGAMGLMQLLPSTARSLGVGDVFSPVENIDAGVRHLRNLYDQLQESEGRDRLLISLAAYNTGIGHIQDAQRLATKLGLDPDKWASLRETLPMLKFRKYYKDARHGYCRGDEPVTYVKQIQIYYDILRRRGIEDALPTTGEADGRNL